MEIANSGKLIIRHGTREDSRLLQELLRSADMSHEHADWRLPADWFGHSVFVVAELKETKGKELQACIVLAADPPPAAWVRLAVIRQSSTALELLSQLLKFALPHIASSDVNQLAWLPHREWSSDLIRLVGFQKANHITTFIKQDKMMPDTINHDTVIRSVCRDDILLLAEIESHSFDPLWRHSAEGLLLAYDRAISFDVASLNGRIVGFQYSVKGMEPRSAHLVRITVTPDSQRMGVGSALLARAIDDFWERKIYIISLNTQTDNYSSHLLYAKFGFVRTGNDLPIWVLRL